MDKLALNTVACGISLILLVMISSCLPPDLTSKPDQVLVPHPYYFTARTKDSVEIVELNLGASKGETNIGTLYRVPRFYPISALPSIEQGLINTCTEVDCAATNISIEKVIGGVQGSPDNRFVLWNEALVYCPVSSCIGVGELIVWDRALLEKQTILSLPFHLDSTINQSFSEVTWSPTNQFLAYMLTNDLLPRQLQVVNIHNKRSIQIDGDVQQYQWSPTGNQIAYVKDEGSLMVAGVSDKALLSRLGDWVNIYSIDWSADGQKIAVVAQTERGKEGQLFTVEVSSQKVVDESAWVGSGFTTAKYSPDGKHLVLRLRGGQDLRILDIGSRKFIDTNDLQGNVAGLKLSWAPDGQVFAIAIYDSEKATQWSHQGNGIVVIDTHNGKQLARLNIKGINDTWLWYDSGNQLILNLQSQSESCVNAKQRGIGIFNWESGKLTPLVFDVGM